MLYRINNTWIICFAFKYFKIRVRVYQIASKNPPRIKTYFLRP